jgi:arylsulfatase A-like enzyme
VRLLASGLAILGFGGSLAAGASSLPAKDSLRGANLVVISLDTTRADRLGAYGKSAARTPNLDRLAREGLRFDAAFSVAPLTLPSHTSIFSGLYPANHGTRNNGEQPVAADVDTMAEIFARRGYDTAAFVSSFVLDRRFGLRQGFATYDDHVETTTSAAFSAGHNQRTARATIDATLTWLGARRSAAPLFLWVHLFDAHAPYAIGGAPAVAPAEAYQAEIAAMDLEIGRLMTHFAAAKPPVRTFYLIVGDHGESLGEHGEETHAVFVYDAVMHVPLILTGPGVAPGVDSRLVSQVDLLPTIAQLFSLAPRAPMDGASLLGPLPPDRAIFHESLAPWLDYGWAPLFASRTADAKYIDAPRPEFYALRDDPQELRDLGALADRSAAQDLRRRLETFLAASRFGRVQAPQHVGPGDDETRARLRSLGYLGGAGPAVTDQAPPDAKDRVAVLRALRLANDALDARNPTGALDILRGLEPTVSRDRSVLRVLAKTFIALGRTREAEAVLREFRRGRPRADQSLLLAQILILDRRFDEAEELLDEAQSLEPDHGGVEIARGDLAAIRGDVAAARRHYERAATSDPRRAAGAARARLARLSAPAPAPAAPPGR